MDATARLSFTIPSAEPALAARLRAAVDGKAKPPGSLGRLEDLAVRLGTIRNTEAPRADKAVLLLFAGDHGLCEEGVSAYPSAVTAAMVATLLAGRAAASVFARSVGAEIRVVDAGVTADLSDHAGLVHAKVRSGTRNAAREAALTPAEVGEALERGAAEAARAVGDGADVVLIGEMGIGNTAAAALLMHRLLPAPLERCIGLGAGHDEAGIARKRDALARAAARTGATETFEVLAEFGGLEILMMAGAALGAAAARRPVVVDGFIATVAALVAVRIRPEARDSLIFAHRSAEAGHALLLETLGASPLLDLGLRLGEGTGGLLALPLLRAAAAMLSDMATLEEVLAGAA
ncbi:nicotinate-nucleotide--dimethylbenzimidazole phosphoribosyltransferase [Enterovirga rhinocerotis]|uniref:Nicotinate-nucleotide--dimethylbenzimidazole phosphoribosyltransferase n=1 Tax=Enterovirga rhinocerotis TaxID=1339210 RepID=A0A4R7BT71_9HYPH|nr:nicotinate-nucleotide--dimethylbenzimidazole phosphoribosyltransferase [Enterovirga rhinocerotis]TDR87307.1 nicotinate-nucleotide-dimethylbenzimidazole phosphoribosyltransferase [Enterovirga rhinocerotis]